jgi:hypothetical protein
MAEATTADISNTEAAKAANSSVIALLRSLEVAEYRRESLKGLCHRLSCIARTLESFAAIFDQPGSCKLSLKTQHQLRIAFRATKTPV